MYRVFASKTRILFFFKFPTQISEWNHLKLTFDHLLTGGLKQCSADSCVCVRIVPEGEASPV